MRVEDYIEKTNWLAHRWPITVEAYTYSHWTFHAVKIEGRKVHDAGSAEQANEWRTRFKPTCLARFIASKSAVHPAEALVVAGPYRLGRIPPELWCGYDTVQVLGEPPFTLLSAKVRAMFPEWPNALLRVVRHDQVAGLRLRHAPNRNGARLTVVK